MSQMNLYTKQKQSHKCRKQTFGYLRGKGKEGYFGRLALTYTLLYMKWVTDKDLLYSTEKSI